MDVSKPQEALTTDEFISSLMESPDQPEEEVTTAEDTAEEADQSDAEAEEAEEVTASDDSEEEPEEAEEEDAAPQDDDVYQVGDEEFTLAELKDWKAGGLRNKDYTEKTQKLSAERKAFEAERTSFNAEQQQLVQQIQQQQAQLQDALATYAIAPVEEPNWSQLKPEQIGPAIAQWNEAKARKDEAAAQYRALQQQQQEETRQREIRAALQHFPQWSDPAVFQQDFPELAQIAEERGGFSREELASYMDHRMYRLLMSFRTVLAATDTTKAVTTKAEKKLVQAAKKVTPGVKGAQDRGAKKQRQQQMQRLKKTGSVDDFAELLMGGA